MPLFLPPRACVCNSLVIIAFCSCLDLDTFAPVYAATLSVWLPVVLTIHYVCLRVARAERVVCADKREDCAAVLIRTPTLCQEQPDFAWMMCPLACGVCSGKLTYLCQSLPPWPVRQRHFVHGKENHTVVLSGLLLRVGKMILCYCGVEQRGGIRHTVVLWMLPKRV